MRLAAMLLGATASLVLAAGLSAADSSEAQGVRRVLDPRHRAERTPAQIVQELVTLGPRAAPAMVGMLVGTLPGPDWEASGLSLEEARAAESSEEGLLLEALRALPPKVVAQALGEACGSSAGLDTRLVCLRVLGDVGAGDEAVHTWRDLSLAIEPLHRQRAYVRAQVESALARCLERSAAGFDPLAHELRNWEPVLFPAIVRACTDANRRQGIEILTQLRGVERALDLEILANLPGLAQTTTGRLAELPLSWVRGFLADEDPLVRRSSVLALGRVCDAGSAPGLLAALDDADARVAQSALWSLKNVSRRALADDRDSWALWLAAESQWWDSEHANVFQALESKDPQVVVAALQRLCQHPLYRHESAAAVAPLLEHEDQALVLLACAALVQLDSMVAADELAALETRPEEEVRAAAQAALRQLGRAGR